MIADVIEPEVGIGVDVCCECVSNQNPLEEMNANGDGAAEAMAELFHLGMF